MKIHHFVFALLSAIVSGNLLAGAVQPYIPVEVDMLNGYASGNMLAARTSKNDVEHIGCAVTINEDDSAIGLCNAQDPDGNAITCRFVNSEALTGAVLGISDYSFISFTWEYDDNWAWEGCTSIRVSNRSFYLPGKK